MEYDLNDKPKAGHLFLYALQWWIVIIPTVITIGLVVGKLHFGADTAAQGWYMQKLFFVLGVTLLTQILAGHKLPLVVGPASVLLIGIIATSSASIPAIYTAILIGGVLLALFSAFGLLTYFRKIFTLRVIIVIMLLIPVTLGPTLIKLIFVNDQPVLFNLFFAVLLSIALLSINHIAKGVWKSATLAIGIAAATAIYNLCGFELSPVGSSGRVSADVTTLFAGFEFDAGVILSFIFCSFALMVNEIGSIEAVGQVLKADKMEQRVRRGVGITGLANMLAGLFGVTGPIDYSSSPGIIASTRCASRFPFIPAAILLILCAFSSDLVQVLLTIPNVVMGTILLYVMINQFSAGFQMMVNTRTVIHFSDGASIGIALMVALIISFIPPELSAEIPSLIRPIIANGFVMGVFTILVMEHLVYKGK